MSWAQFSARGKTSAVLILLLMALVTFPLLLRAALPNQANDSPEGNQSCSMQPCSFDFRNEVLSIHTKILSMKIEQGAVTYVADNRTGEVMVRSVAREHWPLNVAGFAGFTVQTPRGRGLTLWPSEKSTVEFTSTDPYHGQLTYRSIGLLGTDNNSRLLIDIQVDASTGEIVMQLTGLAADRGYRALSIDMPITESSTSSVVLGSGASYSRTDAHAVDQTSYANYGLFSPTMAVVQGSKSVLAVWSEATQFAPEYIQLNHTLEYDQLVLHAGPEDGHSNAQPFVSPPWRIGLYGTWVTAAQRWRQRFEERTGAKPLWENPVPWVRNIHAVFDATYQDFGTDQAKYAELARTTDPQKTLFLLWNGDRIVLLGDPTLAAQIGRPSPDTLWIIKSLGWPLLLYHPYNLIYSEAGTRKRLEELAAHGWLPANYKFNPDYGGSPDSWQQYWADVKAPYYDGSKLDVIHPGSAKFEAYLARNLADYLTMYGADGAYFDTLGGDHGFLFPDGKKVVDSYSYPLGEAEALRKVEDKLPNVAIMSEYQSAWVLPLIFFSWEGPATHIEQDARAGTHLNHPLRVALVGSYAWTRESNEEGPDDIASALMGSLPQVSLVGDSKVSNERALWSQQRAQLFCDEELFNDLPDQWENGVLAYYRSRRTGHWFKFERIGSSYGYVEILGDGREVVRLVKG